MSLKWVGDFVCTSGGLVLSDPCYKMFGVGTAQIVVPRGVWHAQVDREEVRGCGMRNKMLRAFAHGYEGRHVDTPLGIELFVDSGQMGIFDREVYRVDSSVPSDFADKGGEILGDSAWYSYCCHHTLNTELSAGVINGGVVSSSGLGDGGYEGRISRNDKAEVVVIEILFMADDDDDDDDFWT